MPDLGSVHIDQALTNLSLAYTNKNYVADEIFPKLNVEKRSDKYFIYSRDAALAGSGLDVNGKALSLRRPDAQAQTMDFTLSTDLFFCEEFAKRKLVTDAERKLADNPLQPDNDATEFLSQKMLLDNEMMVAWLVGNPANYPATNKATLTNTVTGGVPVGTSWAQYTSNNSNPMLALLTAISAVMKGILMQPNSFFITHDAGRVLSEHPVYKDEFKQVSKEGLTASGLCPYMKGLNVLDGAQQTTAGNVWNATDGQPFALVYYKAPGEAGQKSVHFGRTFDAPDDLDNTHGPSTRRYRQDDLKGDYIETSMLRDHKFVSVDSNGKALGGYAFFDVMI